MGSNDVQTQATISLVALILAVGCALGLLYLLGGNVAGKTPVATGRRWMNWAVMLFATSAFFKVFTSLFGGTGNAARALVEGILVTVVMGVIAFAIGAIVARLRGGAETEDLQAQPVTSLKPKIIVGTVVAIIGISAVVAILGYPAPKNANPFDKYDAKPAVKEDWDKIGTPLTPLPTSAAEKISASNGTPTSQGFEITLNNNNPNWLLAKLRIMVFETDGRAGTLMPATSTPAEGTVATQFEFNNLNIPYGKSTISLIMDTNKAYIFWLVEPEGFQLAP